VFRYIELPKMMGVLMIAILLRFMDSFMIYTEPFVVTGGGPGNSTTLLSIDLVKMALGQFDLGPAAAFSIMYFLVILLISLGVLHRDDQSRQEGWRVMINRKAIVMALYLLFLMLPIYWLINMSLKTNQRDPRVGFTLFPRTSDAANYARSSPIRPGIWAMSTRSSM
jgi:ABC-type glycerol-3-phosphate transport system permease component